MSPRENCHVLELVAVFLLLLSALGELYHFSSETLHISHLISHLIENIKVGAKL
jgi:hypothetical protein